MLRVKLTPKVAWTFQAICDPAPNPPTSLCAARNNQRVKLICPRNPRIGSIHHTLPESEVGRALSIR